jgi:hypothetical protein
MSQHCPTLHCRSDPSPDGEDLPLPFAVGYTRNLALEPKEFRDRSFSPNGGRAARSDKLSDSSTGSPAFRCATKSQKLDEGSVLNRRVARLPDWN